MTTLLRATTATSLCFNHAGASPSSAAVVHCMTQHLQLEQRLGGYQAARTVQDELAAVYTRAAQLIHAASPHEIALTESATVAWTRLFYAFCAHHQEQEHGRHRRRQSSHKKVILVAQAEYAANLVAASQWATTHPGWTVQALPSVVDENGQNTGKVDMDALKSMLAGKYRINDNTILDPASIAVVCVTHVPTNAGIVNPMTEIGQCLADYNNNNQRRNGDNGKILYLADTCQSVGHLPIHVQEMQCDGLVATGRKYLRGPRGTGFLYLREQIANRIMPHHVDHYGVPVSAVPSAVDIVRGRPVQDVLAYAPRRGSKRFEFWESNVAGRLGLGQALSEVLERGQDSITDTIFARTQYLVEKLLQVQNHQITLHHCPPQCGIVTFWVPGIESARLFGALLAPSTDGIVFETSVVPATSTPLDSALTGVPDLLRASVSYTTTEDEIDLFVHRLDDILKNDMTT